MTQTRRRALVSVAAAVMPLPIPTLVKAQSAPLTIRVASVPTEQVLPFAYARRAGLFERAGVRIELSMMSSGVAIAAAVTGGATDIGVSSLLPIVVGFAKGVPFTIVAPSGLWTATSEGGLLVANGSTIHSAKDFAGKTVAVGALNDISSLSIFAWLEQNAVDPKSIKLLEVPQSAAPAALEQGRVDAIILSNPAYTVALMNAKARPIANIYSAISTRMLFGAWFSTTDWVARNRTAAERFARVIAEASPYVNAHVAETTDDLVAFTGVDRSLALRMKRTPFTPSVNAAEIQPIIDVAAKYKVLEKPYPAAQLVSEAAVK